MITEITHLFRFITLELKALDQPSIITTYFCRGSAVVFDFVSHVSTYREQKRSGQPSQNSFGCLTLAGAFKKGSERPITGSVVRCKCVCHACGCADKTALSLYQQNYNLPINTKCSARMHQQHFGAHFCSHWLVKNAPVLQVVCDKLWPPYQIVVGNNTRHSVWKLKWLFEKCFSSMAPHVKIAFISISVEQIIFLLKPWSAHANLQFTSLSLSEELLEEDEDEEEEEEELELC